MKTRRLSILASLFMVILVIGITALAVTQLPLQQTTTAKYVLSPSTLVKTADVTIFKDGDYAVAVDEKGQTIIRSIDHAEVIQVAIDYVAKKGGGKIYIEQGNYLLYHTLIINSSYITLEGNYPYIRLADGVNDDVIRILNASFIVIKGLHLDGNKQGNPYQGTWNKQSVIYVKSSSNIYIIGNLIDNGTTVGLHVDGGSNVLVKDNIIRNCDWYGIHGGTNGTDYVHRLITVNNYVIDSGTGIGIAGHKSIISHNYVINYSNVGIEVDLSAIVVSNYVKTTVSDAGSCIAVKSAFENEKYVIAYNYVEHVRNDIPLVDITVMSSSIDKEKVYSIVEGNTIVGGSRPLTMQMAGVVRGNIVFPAAGFSISVNADNVIVSNNYVVVGGAYGGIVVEANNVRVIGNTLIGNGTGEGIRLAGSNNIVVDNHITNFNIGINEYGDSDYNIISNNIIKTCNVYVNNIGIHSTIKNNIGYVTENHGTAIIPAGTTSITVNHGLSTTPSVVIVTTNDTSVVATVTNINSTSFTITLSVAPTTPVLVYWEAKA